MECIVLSARNFPADALRPLIQDLLKGYMELHDEPASRLSAMQSSLKEGLRGAGVISAVLESRADELWLRVVCANGRIVDLQLAGGRPEGPLG